MTIPVLYERIDLLFGSGMAIIATSRIQFFIITDPDNWKSLAAHLVQSGFILHENAEGL